MFEEGHYAQVEVAARVRTSDQSERARDFLQFMLSDGASGLSSAYLVFTVGLSVTVGGGNWQSEISRTVYEEGGVSVTGGAPG